MKLRIAVDSSDTLHAVWADNTPDLVHYEIHYKKSSAITLDSNRDIHILWEDDTPGNFEIFYKKGNQ